MGIVTDVQRFSVHDGPGIRTLFFLKGCPFRCPWCSNPETQADGPELLHYAFKCIHCDSCVGVCTRSAVTPEEPTFISAERCTLCGDCVAACPSGALRMIGQEMSVRQVVEIAEKDRLFYANSGGGVTFSGGEPFFQAEFLEQALEALQEAGFHTAIETTGYVAWSVMQKLERRIDLFLYDIKIMDEREHSRVLGVSNTVIISNLRKLAVVRDRVVVRVPVIPGYTADGDNILKIFELVASLPNVKTVQLLPYHGLGKSKYAYAGRAYPVDGTRPPARELMEELVAMGGRLGLDCTVGG